MNRSVSRRAILRGAGVALTLPWLESLAPKEALAQEVVLTDGRTVTVDLSAAVDVPG